MNKFKLSIGLLIIAGMLFSTPALALTPPQPASERLPFIRLYNPNINDHFYTSSRVEADVAIAVHGYRIEGEMGYVEKYQQDGTEPIYRMWNPNASKHFYTTSYDESVAAQASGFIREGVVGFMLANSEPVGSGFQMDLWEGRVKVYRLYNPVQRKHFYTSYNAEAQSLQSYGYVLEGQLGGGLFNSSTSPVSLLRICPDQWIVNAMPGVDVGDPAVYSEAKEYFIINGQRAEIVNYDLEWIENNCSVEKIIAY